MKYVIANVGPISVALDAASSAFMMYSGGEFDQCPVESQVQLDHAVTLIGYSESAWLAQNSWGDRWGMNGYLWLKMNTVSTCGLFQDVSYPIVDNCQPIN